VTHLEFSVEDHCLNRFLQIEQPEQIRGRRAERPIASAAS